jgi:iron(II)-dependent oxidoreductase
VILAAGPAGPEDGKEPGLIRLESVTLPRPTLNGDVLAALAEPGPVVDEVRAILAERGADAACWADTLWGLGYLNPVPDGVVSALMVHKIRPRGESRWHQALAAVDVVCPASAYLADEGGQAGLDTRNWATVPNALLTDPAPVPYDSRELLRTQGPVRIVSRVEPAKGLAELLTAIPPDWDRPVELVLAEADFEFWPGMQRDVIAACRIEAVRRPGLVTILPALGWREVPPYLAGACATIISSIEPETFCHTAAEALSVGTPVVTFDIGNVPRMAGQAGRIVSGLHAKDLWASLQDLLHNHDSYHAASIAAPGQITDFTPHRAATTLLTALDL